MTEKTTEERMRQALESVIFWYNYDATNFTDTMKLMQIANAARTALGIKHDSDILEAAQ